VLAQWWHPVAFCEALDPLLWLMRAVLYCRIAMAIKTARKVGVFIHCCVVDCRPGVRGSNTEQVVAQWRRLVASDMALNILHRAMLHESLQCLRMAIKMACSGGAFVLCRRFFCSA
jgi:hypothetical protein